MYVTDRPTSSTNKY